MWTAGWMCLAYPGWYQGTLWEADTLAEAEWCFETSPVIHIDATLTQTTYQIKLTYMETVFWNATGFPSAQ